MVPVSIVIITKNEAATIAACIEKCRLISDDIVVVDNDSIDGTPEIAGTYGCRIFKKTWDGYGANKNKGIALAKYDWILSIDADEMPDVELAISLHQLNFSDPCTVYDIKFRSYFGKKAIRYGSWGRDHHIRLFNRTLVKWSETVVHETLVMPQTIAIKKTVGYIHHYSVKDAAEYDIKGKFYAKLSAKKYFNNGKKANLVKLYISPAFGFIKNYICYLGFLDGKEGWEIAKATLRNTRRKYVYLSQLENLDQKRQAVKDRYAVEY
ncbi:glycosyltransferase family 2 protein [Mucilaginibacter gotjawali]|uniref:Glycosyltransferase involved in cell wall biosynthesis n=1 Tax=Mucilaginibacter gotjawali TaxID=1550579 RepID=A0A839S918_9SPHI|nr:glycosyltransferase family 2 protein [Mucilaginibacter gotjawali]MBB3054631.1 glycosyltransferase involved in cell wall biosynthesis [Mucilaginibacter gotjawali]